jgi:hypothetical protein
MREGHGGGGGGFSVVCRVTLPGVPPIELTLGLSGRTCTRRGGMALLLPFAI